jgi:hypothetical protein
MGCGTALPNGPSPTVLNDIAYWRAKLSKQFCGLVLCNPPPPSLVEFWVNTLTSYGVGVVFASHWVAWQFCTGWKTNGCNIGWAKMITIELGIWVVIELGFHNTHFLVQLDNTGVIGSVQAGKARNTEQNCSLQHIVVLMQAHSLWITSEYVASVVNIADTPSQGVPATDRKPPVPPCLALYLCDK